ncbi:DUF4149 domain-containing protein [Candidatus Vallotiella sp. (ex Adelges kitamiensis)]|uniref:DUF4149 domain-containing protein n=1 Tax=Candidatus Vallotiella sp. (ex Adelges kitamiensis) TaxID=2864217 RepID=UPI001CE28379|nr:DUF4149 domain-containing protein [Candidatus Vallotia sp. (ex Adelges kitamiensis)]
MIIVQRLFRLFAMLWVGGLINVGYLTTPTLFSSLDLVSAGAVAALLFHTQALVSMVTGTVLLGFAHTLVKRGDRAYQSARRVIFMMLICVLVSYFVLQPFINGFQVFLGQSRTDTAHSDYAMRLGALQLASNAIYLIQSLLGLVLVWRLPVATRSMF